VFSISTDKDTREGILSLKKVNKQTLCWFTSATNISMNKI
jgi:hypothetical protein